MKIALVAHPVAFNEKDPSGLGTSTNCVIRSMIKNHPNIDFVVFTKGTPLHKPVYNGSNWRLRPLPNKFLWLDRFFPRDAGFDAHLFVSSPVMPLTFTPKNSIVVARDFGILQLRIKSIKQKIQNYLIRFFWNSAFKRCSGVIAISEETREQVIKYYKIPRERVQVIYNGFTNQADDPALRDEESIIGVREPFFSYLGVLKERKNIETALKAFAEFKKTDAQNFQFVLSGKKGGDYYEKLLQVVKDNNIEDSVIFTGYVSEKEMVFLFKRARAFVYVSLLEGFGKPPLEAMSYGTPAIISDEPPINEISGPGGYLVNPHDPIDIAEAMKEVATNNKTYDSLVKKGYARASDFSWDETARKYVMFTESIINSTKV